MDEIDDGDDNEVIDELNRKKTRRIGGICDEKRKNCALIPY